MSELPLLGFPPLLADGRRGADAGFGLALAPVSLSQRLVLGCVSIPVRAVRR